MKQPDQRIGGENAGACVLKSVETIEAQPKGLAAVNQLDKCDHLAFRRAYVVTAMVAEIIRGYAVEKNMAAGILERFQRYFRSVGIPIR